MLASWSLVLFTLIAQRYLPYDTAFGFQTHRPRSLGLFLLVFPEEERRLGREVQAA